MVGGMVGVRMVMNFVVLLSRCLVVLDRALLVPVYNH